MLRTFAQLFVIATFTLLSCSETRREEHAGRVMQNDGVAALGDMLIECGFIKLPFYNHYHDSWAPRLVAVGQDSLLRRSARFVKVRVDTLSLREHDSCVCVEIVVSYDTLVSGEALHIADSNPILDFAETQRKLLLGKDYEYWPRRPSPLAKSLSDVSPRRSINMVLLIYPRCRVGGEYMDSVLQVLLACAVKGKNGCALEDVCGVLHKLE